jgi:lipopolysaccharide assembly protein A
MGRIFRLIFLLLVLVLGLALHVKNDEPVALNYYVGIIDLPLSLVIVSSLAVGALCGIIASLTVILRLKRDNLRLSRQVKAAEQEVSNLRAIPIKDVL